MMFFSVLEYKERLAKTKQSMEKEGIDVLLLTNPGNMCYLTGYDAWSFYVHQMLIVALDEEEPIWVGRGIDASAARFTTWLKDENIIPYPDDHVQSASKHPMDYVCKVLQDKQMDTKVIAMELDTYYFTAKCYLRLTQGLPNATIKDGHGLVNWVKIVKSEKEIEYMRRAGIITTKAMQAGIDAIQAGVRQCDVVADINYVSTIGTKEFGGDYPGHVPLLPSGEQTSACHMTWTDEPLVQGEPSIIEMAGCYRRYNVPMARTVSIGEPSDELKYLADVCIEGIDKALNAVKPGITSEEVEMAWRKSIEKKGFKKESRIGYSIGLNFPPSWGEETVSIRPGDKTILQPNMTLHIIPGMWLDGIGMEISQSFIVTDNGYEQLGDIPRELFVK